MTRELEKEGRIQNKIKICMREEVFAFEYILRGQKKSKVSIL